MVYNLAFQYLGRVEEAEEITQDVFVKVYFHLKKFREEAQLKTWIYRITVNACLDHFKSLKAKKRGFLQRLLPLDAYPGVEVMEETRSDLWMEQKESVRKILQAVYDLPHQQKMVILLLRFENLSQQEVSEILRCSVKAVESSYQRAKKNLEKKLNPSEGEHK